MESIRTNKLGSRQVDKLIDDLAWVEVQLGKDSPGFVANLEFSTSCSHFGVCKPPQKSLQAGRPRLAAREMDTDG